MPKDKDGTFVSMNSAYDAWEPYAVSMLEDTARKYNAVVTYKQLADYVQGQSGISHNALLSNWIGELLGRVINHCVNVRIPQLSSLCVREDGTVGDGYRHAMSVGGESDAELNLDQLDDHAAKTRLDCYRHFEAAGLPPDGGTPTLTPAVVAARKRKRDLEKRDEPPKVCPTCSMVLPVTGRCDNCG